MLANPSFNGRPSPPSPFLHSIRSRSLLPTFCPGFRRSGKLRFCSFTSLPSRNTKSYRVRALTESNESGTTNEDTDRTQCIPQPCSVKIPVGDRHILVETGLIGRQASGAVTVTDGETIVYTSVCFADVPSEPSDFFPLSVNYQERFSAAGRTSGGFFKREGRAKDHEVLICRLIDRPLRPTMPIGCHHETQILSWVLSYDGLHSPDSLALTAAGIAVALSEVPNSKAIAGVRIGLVDDKFIVNPTTREMEDSELDLIMAGTDNAILMIEGYCNFLPEEKLLQAVEVGQDAIRAICSEVETLVKKCGKPKMLEAIKLPPPELYRHVEEIAGDELVKVLQIRSKIPRKKALSALEEKVLAILTEKGYVSKDEALAAAEATPDLFEDEDEDEEVVVDGEVDEGDVHIKPISRKRIPLFFSEVDVKLVFKEVTSKFLRKRIVEGGKRSDGRTPSGIRVINSRCGLLPRAHGSALFTRGETQSLAVVTLGDKQMAQRIDNLVDVDESKRFYLQGLCHISELSTDWLAKAEDVVKVGDHVDVKLIEINEKGQLCLSRRALLPEASPEQDNAEQQTSTQSDENASSQNTEKGPPKKIASTLKGRLAAGDIEPQPQDDTKLSASPKKSNFADESLVKPEKTINRLVNPMKGGPYINKARPKKSSSKAVSSVFGNGGTSLVDGEAKVG